MEDNLTLRDIDTLLLMDDSSSSAPTADPTGGHILGTSATTTAISNLAGGSVSMESLPSTSIVGGVETIDNFSSTLAAEAKHRAENDMWWNALVMLVDSSSSSSNTNGRTMTRVAALPIIQRVLRFDHHQHRDTGSSTSEEYTTWYGRDIQKEVLERLSQLPVVGSTASASLSIE
jgi:hypothetical protein